VKAYRRRALLLLRVIWSGSMLGVGVPVTTVQAQAVDSSRSAPPARGVTDADVRFMQEMIGHHQQAVAMVALVPQRTRRRDLRVLAERIDLSQSDEIVQMRAWLAKHGPKAPTGHDMTAHAMDGHAMPVAHGAAPMPGMLTAAQMTALRQASGARFDRLFLEGMIQHHIGALTMVRQLMATPGAAQESRLNRFVIDVDADQRAEIARMKHMVRATR
jgi:uncharacterized protein (DUF305 family)